MFYPHRHSLCLILLPSPLILLPFVFDNAHHRITRELSSQKLSKFLNNLIYNSNDPLSFETSRNIYTVTLTHEHLPFSPNNIYIPIAHVFTTFLNNLLEKNNLSFQHVFIPSSIQTLLQKESLFDLPNIEQFCTIEIKPHHWLTTDIPQIH